MCGRTAMHGGFFQTAIAMFAERLSCADRRRPPASSASSRPPLWSWASRRTAMGSDASPRRRCRRDRSSARLSDLSAPLPLFAASVHRHTICSNAVYTSSQRQEQPDGQQTLPLPRIGPAQASRLLVRTCGHTPVQAATVSIRQQVRATCRECCSRSTTASKLRC